jgi:hypothetical protein
VKPTVRDGSLAIIGEVAHPFGFFGIKPTLFDAPSHPNRDKPRLAGHSFLCDIADFDTREVRALAGFSWGFTVIDGVTAVIGPLSLGAADWNRHFDLLHSEHPAWRFTANFHVV